MARFGVRWGSLERRSRRDFRSTMRLERTRANRRERLDQIDNWGSLAVDRVRMR
jgi:hypothetical protein